MQYDVGSVDSDFHLITGVKLPFLVLLVKNMNRRSGIEAPQ